MQPASHSKDYQMIKNLYVYLVIVAMLIIQISALFTYGETPCTFTKLGVAFVSMTGSFMILYYIRTSDEEQK